MVHFICVWSFTFLAVFHNVEVGRATNSCICFRVQCLCQVSSELFESPIEWEFCLFFYPVKVFHQFCFYVFICSDSRISEDFLESLILYFESLYKSAHGAISFNYSNGPFLPSSKRTTRSKQLPHAWFTSAYNSAIVISFFPWLYR